MFRRRDLTPPSAAPVQVFTHVPSPSELTERAEMLRDLADLRERLAKFEGMMATLPTGWVGATIEATLREHSRLISNNERRINQIVRRRPEIQGGLTG